MPKFKKGDRVRKNLWTGLWTIEDFNEETKTYHISQVHTYPEFVFPEGNVAVYHRIDGKLEQVLKVREITVEYHQDVSEEELKSLPDDKTLQMQQHLKITDNELEVLRKIDGLVGNNQLEYSIPVNQFTAIEFEAIQNLMWKQHWFRIGERSIYGLGEFLKQDDKSITITSPIKPILHIYRDYK